jgi:hypothetical protein
MSMRGADCCFLQRTKTTRSRRGAVLGTYGDALCFRCSLYARMTRERVEYAYVMRGNQKSMCCTCSPLFFRTPRGEPPQPRSCSTLLSRMCIFFGPCTNWTIKGTPVPKSPRGLSWLSGILCACLAPCQNFDLLPSPLARGCQAETRQDHQHRIGTRRSKGRKGSEIHR